jgi:hypothetical protein
MIEHLVNARRLVRGIVVSRSFKVVGHFITILIASILAIVYQDQVIYNYFFSAIAILCILSMIKSLK